VVTFNQRAFIEGCLRSILEQDVAAEVQVLVGDDASSDGTSAIVQALVLEFGECLLHFQRESNMGALVNMRDLMSRARGDYIARVDGDDYWLPGKLARQLHYMQAHPGCSAVYTNAITIDEAGRVVGLFNDLGDTRLDLSALVRRGNALNNSSVLFRAAHAAAWVVGCRIDYQAHLWHAQQGWLGHIGEPLVAYRVNTRGSLVFSANEHIRKLYWEAIQSVPRDLISDDDYAHGIADFLRRVCFRAVRTRNLSLLRLWGKVVFAASPYGRSRTAVLVLASILRMAGKLAKGLLAARSRPSVLYRH
jgi:glycosyltransferase involved in cell wall biosynthesis